MSLDILEIVTTILGLFYIWLEYRGSIWLWLFGIVMPVMQVYLYWSHGMYAFAGLTCYYTLAAVYGLLVWKFKKTRNSHAPLPIIYMPRRLYMPTLLAGILLWGVTYVILYRFTDSQYPLMESFVNDLSFVGLWALARKFLEQWFFWIVANAVSCIIYAETGMYFYLFLYGLYDVIAVAGYFKWKKEVYWNNGERNKEDCEL